MEKNYKYYKAKICFETPISTPLQADTIWGHICWGIKYFESEDSLNNFLKSYEKNAPPILVSDGFYENTLPCPILTPFVSENISLEQMTNLKTKKKIKVIPANLIFENKKLSINSLIDAGKDKSYLKTVLRNTIDRLTDTTMEPGGLYETDEIWFKNNTIFDIYIVSYLDQSTIEKYFKYAFAYGYGKDASTGKGIIKEDIKIQEIQVNANGNRALALASFVPSVSDNFANLYSNIFTKYGKLGGTYATTENPFKKPIVMFKTGATFETDKKRFFIGSLLKNVHKNPKIRHYAYAPIIYFNEEVYNA